MPFRQRIHQYQSLADVIMAEVYQSLPVAVEEGNKGNRGDISGLDSEKLCISTKDLIKFLNDLFRERIKAGGGLGDKKSAEGSFSVFQ